MHAMRCTAVFLLALACLLEGCSRSEPPPPSAAATPRPVRLPRPKHFQTHWQDESQYIVESVVTDLVEMSVVASEGTAASLKGISADAYELSPSKPTAYEVVVNLGEARGTMTSVVSFEHPIWAPESYRALALALTQRLKVSPHPASTAEKPALLEMLLTPKAETLASADVQLSKDLAGQFTSAVKHEEAALLLASFSLRQAEGPFYEGRSELCRATAHLAFAETLQGGQAPSVTGSVAKAAHMVAYNAQAAALEQLNHIPDSEQTTPWKRALRMRATNDYRIYGETDHPTLLETREWFRARAQSVDVDRAWTSLRLTEEEKQLADWAHFARSHETSIRLGHTLLRTALASDLREFSAVVAIERGRGLGQPEMVDLLNQEPVRCVSANGEGISNVQVLGLGRWAAFAQRNICSTIATDFHFMNSRWGVPEKALRYRDEMDKLFWGLRLYPFVRRQNSTAMDYYHKAQDEEMALVRRSPHLVPSEVWNDICYNVPFGPRYIPPPHGFINEWHKLNPPPGTAYDPFPRLDHPSLVRQPDFPARLEQMRQIAPYDPHILYHLAKYPEDQEATAEKIEQVYAPVLDYDEYPNRRIAKLNTTNSAKFHYWIAKAAALDPSNLETLAHWYAERKQDDLAAATYAQWIANEIDELRVANSADWLVQYFERKGRIESAAALAERAANTGSSVGFLTKAHHLQRMGKIDEALGVYLENQERYNAPQPLITFVMKLPASQRTPRCEQQLNQSLKLIFPSGLQKLALSAKSAAPKTGVRFQSETDAMAKVGIRKGDIVATVRGYQVPNFTGYLILRDLDENAPYEIWVWRQDHYFPVKLPAGFRFGFNMEDFSQP